MASLQRKGVNSGLSAHAAASFFPLQVVGASVVIVTVVEVVIVVVVVVVVVVEDAVGVVDCDDVMVEVCVLVPELVAVVDGVVDGLNVLDVVTVVE